MNKHILERFGLAAVVWALICIALGMFHSAMSPASRVLTLAASLLSGAVSAAWAASGES